MKLKYTGQFEVSLEFTQEAKEWFASILKEYQESNDTEMLSKAFTCLPKGVTYGSDEHIKEFIKYAFNLYFIENILEFNDNVIEGFDKMNTPCLEDFRSELKEAEDKQLCLNI